MIRDYLKFAVENLRNRQLRSFLTVIGIVIGVAAIIALISVGKGLENSITEQFEKMGSNRIYVMPKTPGPASGPPIGEGLTSDDVEALEKMPYFEFVNPYYWNYYTVTFNREKKILGVVGAPLDNLQKRLEGIDLTLEKGRYPTANEHNTAIIGFRTAYNAFDETIRINNKIKIGGKDFKVIGIFDEIGNPEDDNTVYISLKTAQEIFGRKDAVSMIELVAKKGVDLNQVASKVQRRLEKSRGNDNFEVQTPEQLLAQFNDVLMIVRIVLIGIAAISLLVGAVGIMNSMYTSVLERTKEIGIMKAIGAKNSSIAALFMIESGIIGFMGGVFGVLVGSLISFGIGKGAAISGFSMLKVEVFDPGLVAFGLIFAFVVGVISGLLPSLQAMKLKPADTIRHY